MGIRDIDIKGYLTDVLFVNIQALQRAFKKFFRNLQLALLPIIYTGVSLAGYVIAKHSIILAPFIGYLVTCLIVASTMYVIGCIQRKGRYEIGDIFIGMREHIAVVTQIGFLIVIPVILIGIFGSVLFKSVAIGKVIARLINILFVFFWFGLCNTIPEQIQHNDRGNGLHTIKSAIGFSYKNILHWYPINIVVMVLLGKIYSIGFGLFAISFWATVMSGDMNGLKDGIFMTTGIVAIAIWMALMFAMIYRTELFKILNESNYRGRIFKRTTDKLEKEHNNSI